MTDGLTTTGLPSDEHATRGIRLRTRGTGAGPITRLVSPTDLGEILKPFVFLDLANIPPRPGGGFGWHPHSGIATLTIVIEGENEYRETTGVHGGLKPGGIEWMASGKGVWHSAAAVGTRNLKGFQLWMLLPPGQDLAPPASRHFSDADIPREDGVRVLLGDWEGLRSPVPASLDATLLDARIPAGGDWTFSPPQAQELCWLALYSGSLRYGEVQAAAGDLLVFEDGPAPLAFHSDEGAGFIIGSAKRSPYPLHVGYHSVHVSAEALATGEAEIARLGLELRAKGLV